MNAAFVSGAAGLTPLSSSFRGTQLFSNATNSAVCSPATHTVSRRSLRMADADSDVFIKMPERFSRAKQERVVKVEATEQQPKGFTPYAEVVNGRLAMIFFLVGLATEVLSHDHLTMTDQILYMFSPITNNVGGFFMGAAHAASILPPSGMY